MLRRHFIKLSAAGLAGIMGSRLGAAAPGLTRSIDYPQEAWAQAGGQWLQLKSRSGHSFTGRDVVVDVQSASGVTGVRLQAPETELQAVRLVWKYKAGKNKKALGDAWERSYGDLSWQSSLTNSPNPWYLMLSDGNTSAGFGVRTGAATLCHWSLTNDSVILVLDTSSGGEGVKLGSRVLHAADILTMTSRPGESPFAALTRFCGLMCAKPRLAAHPVYGINDWYAVYGNNSAESITRQTAFMADLVTNGENRPFSVIDDGWEVADDFSIPNEKFKDMALMAAKIKSLGMRPGLWTRPLIAKHSDAKSWLAPAIKGRSQNGRQLILDPTIPETLERVKATLRLYQHWGYALVKHDYSTYDIFGRWGSQMQSGLTEPGWHFYDRSKTNAEIINQLYSTIRAAAGDMYIIGCNTMSHLSAGLFELNRTGDDTSGKEWARTRKMGVNTLGFRLPQHRTFYEVDGDCAGLTKEVAWDKNRQWLQLLAESGAPLFISAQPDFFGSEQKAAVKTAFEQASRPQPTAEPLDWMENPWPAKWKLNGRLTTFQWD